MSSPWGQLAAEPRYVLTADQDWAPEWCNVQMLEFVAERQLPLHVFRTSPSPSLDRALADGVITQGWHPNFGPGSTQGDTPRSVVAYCQRYFPGATTARGHAFHESSAAWWALAAAGIRYDSQFPSAHMGHLLPSVHCSGIRRLPVYLEDDVWLETFPGRFDIEPVARTFRTPGLKIFNFHPVQFGLNSPSWEYYDSRRAAVFSLGSDGSGLVHDGVGARTLLASVIGAVEEFVAFHDLCQEVDEILESSAELLGPTMPPSAFR
jgi:hypothetical protein